jgi:glycosyltransferase involved in cell wall biosynthesis
MTAGVAAVVATALRQGAEICHLHDPELLPGGLVLKMLGYRVIYDAHEDYSRQVLSKHYIPSFLRRPAAALAGRLEQEMAAQLDGVVAATEAIAERFSPHCRTVVVRNYPAVSSQPTVDGSRQSADRPFRLVHLSGTLTRERGVSNLVRSMGLLGPGFELVLGGRFVTAAYEREVRSLPGFERVRYAGSVPHATALAEYEQADAGVVCLLPLERYRVSLPVKLFEFMAAGLPVVASDFPLFREIVEGNGCGVCVDPEGPEAIAGAVRRLAADRALCAAMGARGRRAAAMRYSWEKEGERLVAFYEEVLGAKRREETAEGRMQSARCRVQDAEWEGAGA